MRNMISTLALVMSMATSSLADEVWIAVDTSDSFPLLLEDDVALRAGQTVAESIRVLKAKDEVFLRSFGEAGVSATQIHINARIGGRVKPQAAARDIQKLFASLPELVRQGTMTIEKRTNVMGWLERIGPLLNCQDTPTRVIVFTDAIEWSSAIKGSELLQGAPLPSPSGKILDGCHVEFWGVGQQQKKFGNDDRWYPILKAAWEPFMQQAGAASFKAYADFSR